MGCVKVFNIPKFLIEATGYGDEWMGKEAFQNLQSRRESTKPEKNYT
jgi:hypothetical protein